MWARAKWLVGEELIDDVLPNKWIDEEKKLVYWPLKKSTECILSSKSPEKNWHKFQLIKKKICDDDIELCKDYDFTSAASGSELDQRKENKKTERPVPKLPQPPPMEESRKTQKKANLSPSPCLLQKPFKKQFCKPLSPHFKRHISPLKQNSGKTGGKIDTSPVRKKVKRSTKTSTATRVLPPDVSEDARTEETHDASYEQEPEASANDTATWSKITEKRVENECQKQSQSTRDFDFHGADLCRLDASYTHEVPTAPISSEKGKQNKNLNFDLDQSDISCPDITTYIDEAASSSSKSNEKREKFNISSIDLDRSDTVSLDTIYKMLRKQLKIVLEIRNWALKNGLDTPVHSSFQFERLEHRASLRELENKLSDDEYKKNWSGI